MRDELLKIIADLKEMRKLEAAGIMVMANSDDTMFEDCLRRLNELSAQRAEGFATKLSDRVAAMKRDELLVRLGQIGYERDLIVEELDKRAGMNSPRSEE